MTASRESGISLAKRCAAAATSGQSSAPRTTRVGAAMRDGSISTRSRRVAALGLQLVAAEDHLAHAVVQRCVNLVAFTLGTRRATSPRHQIGGVVEAAGFEQLLLARLHLLNALAPAEDVRVDEDEMSSRAQVRRARPREPRVLRTTSRRAQPARQPPPARPRRATPRRGRSASCRIPAAPA